MRHSAIIRKNLILALLLPPAVSCAQGEFSIATFPVTLESIPYGVILKFPVNREIGAETDTFGVFRSSTPEDGRWVTTEPVVVLDYYHDWYKDYFFPEDLEKTFYYRVVAYNEAGAPIARNEGSDIAWTPRRNPPSGFMMAPLAYRKVPLYDVPSGAEAKLLPVNLDITTIYFIGRIYGHNTLEQLTNTRNVLFTRVGVWFLQGDAKVILERETRTFPQISVGLEAAQLLRDSNAPQIQNPSFAFNFKKENSRKFTGLFVVGSKQLGRLQTTGGFIQGDSPAKLLYLTEFLPSASQPKSGLFGGVSYRLTRTFTIEAELIEALGVPEKPLLVNLKLGTAAKTNFDLGYLRYQGGYELLAHFSFRYTLYPQLEKKATDKK